MIKIIANNPSEQDLADYLEAISQPYVKLVTEAHFDGLVDGRVRAIKTEVVNDEIVHTVIFPEECFIEKLDTKLDQLVTNVESLIEENNHLRDLVFELEQNLLAAQDQNHYFKLLNKYKKQNENLQKAFDFAKQYVDCDDRCGYGGCSASCRGRSKRLQDLINTIKEVENESI